VRKRKRAIDRSRAIEQESNRKSKRVIKILSKNSKTRKSKILTIESKSKRGEKR
jgi:hypothetical protein